MDQEVVRATMLLRARTLAMGLSGVRPVLAEALIAMLNEGITPLVPRFGSVGCSGDLGAVHEIYAILFWHYHKTPRAYLDVVVQVADNQDFSKNVRTLFNNDHDNTAKLGVGKNLNYVETAEGKLVDAKGSRARYVRLYSSGNNANDLNHYIEVEVFGRPAK